MKVEFLTDYKISPVEKTVTAPWLSKNSNKFEVLEDFLVAVIDDDGSEHVICVPKGYITDMSSIPRFFWWLFPPSTSGARRASVVHDVIYSHWFRYYSKDFADRLFVAIMKKRDASSFMINIFYTAVKFGGSGGWSYTNNPKADSHWHKAHRPPANTDPKLYEEQFAYLRSLS